MAEAATGDDEDDDDESAVPAADRDIDARRPVVSRNTAKKDEPGRVVRTGQSNQVFSPVVIGYDKSGAEKEPQNRQQQRKTNRQAQQHQLPKRSTTVSSRPVVVKSAPATKTSR